MPENSTHKCTNAVNNVQPIGSSSHMAKILSIYNRLQAGDYENGNGGKRRVSRLTQFIPATLQFKFVLTCSVVSLSVAKMVMMLCGLMGDTLTSYISLNRSR